MFYVGYKDGSYWIVKRIGPFSVWIKNVGSYSDAKKELKRLQEQQQQSK